MKTVLPGLPCVRRLWQDFLMQRKVGIVEEGTLVLK